MNQDTSPFDAKAIVAIVFVFVFWWGWQRHLEQKYPDSFKPQQSVSDVSSKEAVHSDEDLSRNSGENTLNESPTKKATNLSTQKPEELFVFEDSQWQFAVTSRGMGLKDIVLKTYTNRDQSQVKIGASPDVAVFATSYNGEVLDFDIKQVSDLVFEGTASQNGMTVRKIFEVRSGTYSVGVTVEIDGYSKGDLGTHLSDVIMTVESAGFMAPQLERQEFFILHDGGNEERRLVGNEEFFEEVFAHVSLISLGSHYFDLAWIDRSSIMPEVTVRSNPQTGFATATLVHRPSSAKLQIQSQIYAGPKSLDVLKKVDKDLAEVIDFGIFGILARPFLEILKWFYSIVGNYGAAIILLTLLIRGILLPVNLRAYRSMKRMQIIQPHLKAIREKYKDDPQMANRETMALMKENKANPLGGCLPMLLQLPVFIALYQVLGQSIELYQAPFALWINDLSLKDPYYVLPVLMGITMFFQQKITPTTMDPAQAKVMMMMPVVFSLFMLSLPSGLTLYIFVSTLFGIFQQMLTLKEKTPNNNAAVSRVQA